jgi:D-alanyl-D-alanine carboxypeptidase
VQAKILTSRMRNWSPWGAGVVARWSRNGKIGFVLRRFAGLVTVSVLVVTMLATLLGQSTPAWARYASLVVDGESGMELYSRSADTRKYPASLTKIMTLYMVFDALKRGKWMLNTRLKVSRRASRQPQTRLGLKVGQTITVRDAILALVTRSANDVATVIGENLAGTESRFAASMTRQARKLGMSRTTFRNASGLPDKRQLSTARDMVRLATAIREDFPKYYPYFRTKKFRYKGRVYRNHNKLLGRYVGTEGIKTGYTNASGYNLVASVRRDGKHLIGVVFGGKTGARRDRHMIRLLDRGFSKLTRMAKLPTPPLPRPRPDGQGTYAIQLTVATAPRVSALESLGARIEQASATAGSDGLPRMFGGNLEDKSVAQGVARNWGIQVGAYSNNRPAEAVILTARIHLGPTIDHGRDRVERVRRRHGVIYRARIMGLREVEARGACVILLTKHLPCVPVPSDVEVAEIAARQ